METVLKKGDTFKIESGETATVVNIENDDTDIPEHKPLRDMFDVSPINYIIEIEGREGKFRINETDVKKLLGIKEPEREPTQEELDRINANVDIDKLLKEMRGEDIDDQDE